MSQVETQFAPGKHIDICWYDKSIEPIFAYTTKAIKLAVTKSGTGTWDGDGDVGRGTWDLETRRRGTRGRGDAGTRDVGTRGLGDARGFEDVINK